MHSFNNFFENVKKLFYTSTNIKSRYGVYQKSIHVEGQQNLSNRKTSNSLKHFNKAIDPNMAGSSHSHDEVSQNNVNKAAMPLNKTKVVSITYEEIGLFPRSFIRVLDRFLTQLFGDVETLLLQEYRFYRYLFLTTLKTIFVLIFVPLTVNFLAKNYIVRPLTEYFWNAKQTEIFLNSYEQKRAFAELHDFEDKLYFEALMGSGDLHNVMHATHDESGPASCMAVALALALATPEPEPKPEPLWQSHSNTAYSVYNNGSGFGSGSGSGVANANANAVHRYNEVYKIDQISQGLDIKEAQYRLQEKTMHLAQKYNKYSIEALTNLFSDLLSFLILVYLLIYLEIQINITKSFLLEVFFSFEDSKKSLLILLITDLLVGYHSSNLWELLFQFVFYHYGIPENQTSVYLLVATLPVLLDVLFKYLIFRHLNRSSPTTVATYHAIIE